jgi:hypothetical protein
MRNIVLLAAALQVFALPIALIGQRCTPADLQPAAQRVKTIQSQLIAFKIHDEMDEDVPAPLQALIRAFKDSLAELADAELHCASGNPTPKEIESTLATLLNANKPVQQEVYDPKKPPQVDQIYGEDLHVTVTTTAERPQPILIEFKFDIACGYDSMVLAYEMRSDTWQRALRWQSPDYAEVSGAFGDFLEFVILPPTASDGWRAVVAHGHPWCTSRWSGFDLDVLQPSSAGSLQKALLHVERGYVRGDIEPALKIVPDGFQIRLQTGMIDADIMTRIGIYRYRVSGAEVERVQPIANNGRDFVDEWLESPWDESARWSAPANLESLKAVHAKIEAERGPNAEDSPLRTYGPVRACSDAKSHFQVELDAEFIDSKGKSTPDKSTYFQIQEGNNSFTLLSTAEQPDTRCAGVDIMPKK